MTSLSDHESNTVVKLLCVADSGGGKSGALASLVDAGYKLRILDFDNGLGVLRGYIRNKKNISNVEFITLRDELKLTGQRIGYKKANAFQRGMDVLEKGGSAWGEGSTIPPLVEWGEDTVLVVDTLAMAAKSCLGMVMFANAKGMSQAELQHYGTAMDNIENLLNLITSPAVGCHVIVNTHIAIGDNGKQYPEAIGSKLLPKVAKPFDNMVSISKSGASRTFKTSSDGTLMLKTAVKIKDTYPIETGFAQIFADLMGKSSTAAPVLAAETRTPAKDQ
jgi:AAA domain